MYLFISLFLARGHLLDSLYAICKGQTPFIGKRTSQQVISSSYTGQHNFRMQAIRRSTARSFVFYYIGCLINPISSFCYKE